MGETGGQIEIQASVIVTNGAAVSYIEDSLSAGEKVEGLFKLHWFAWVPMVLWLILGVVTFGLTWLVALYKVLEAEVHRTGA